MEHKIYSKIKAKVWGGFFHTLISTTLCLIAFVALLPTTGLNAQSISELGEASSNEVFQLFDEEMESLELEFKISPPNVSVEMNMELISYYQAVIKKFNHGSDIKDAIINTLNLLSSDAVNSSQFSDLIMVEANQNSDFRVSSDGSHSVVIDPEFIAIVEGMDLLENSVEDIELVFDYLRTMKNQ